jgi:hypothetical protein
MGLKYVVDSLEGLPEEQHALYVKADDGKFRLTVEGIPDLTPNVARLEKAIKAEREQREAAEREAKKFEGITRSPEELRTLLARLDNDEELQLITKGDTAKLREKWTEKMRSDYERQLKAKQDAVEQANQKAQRWSSRVLDNAIREATIKVDGLYPSAIDDVLLHGRQLFTLDENGAAVQMRDGAPVMGKDGATAFNPTEWLESMREVKPHWFKATASGGGASQQQPTRSSVGNGATKVLKRAAFDALPPAQRQQHIREGGTVVD